MLPYLPMEEIMFYLTQRDYATILLDGATLFLLAGIFIMSNRFRKRGRADDIWFLTLLVLNSFIVAGDVLGYVFDAKIFEGSRTICMIGMTVFYVSFVLISMAWLQYCRVRFRDGGIFERSLFDPSYLPGIVMAALVLINFFTGWIFMYDENVVYHRGFLFIPMYVLVGLYIMTGFLYVIKYRDRSSGDVLIPVWVYSIPIIFGVIFTFMVPGSASFAPICIAISISFTHMGTVNEVVNRSVINAWDEAAGQRKNTD